MFKYTSMAEQLCKSDNIKSKYGIPFLKLHTSHVFWTSYSKQLSELWTLSYMSLHISFKIIIQF